MSEETKKKIIFTEIPDYIERDYLKDDTELSGLDDIKDSIICAFDNLEEHSEDAIDDLVSAIKKIAVWEKTKT